MADDQDITIRLKAVNEADRELERAKKRVEDLQRSYEDLGKKLKQVEYYGKEYVETVKAQNKAQSDLAGAMHWLETAQDMAGKAHDKYAKLVAKNNKEVEGTFTKLKGEVTSYVTSHLAAIATVERMIHSFKSFAEVERGFNRLRAETGATTEEIEGLEHSIETLSAVTGRSVGELTKSFRQFASISGLGLTETKDLFREVALQAHLTEANMDGLGRAAAAAVNNLKLPTDQAKEVLRQWTEVIPGTMMDVYADAVPKITAQLRSMNVQGADSAKQIAVAFAATASTIGGRETLAGWDSLIGRAKDYGTALGKLAIPRIEGAKDADAVMQGIAETIKGLGLDNPNMGLAQKSVLMRAYGITDADLRLLEEYEKGMDRLRFISAQTGLSMGDVGKNLKAMDRDGKETLDRMYEKFEKIWVQIGKIIMLTGIPNNLLKELEKTTGEIDKIVKLFEWLEKHTPKWLGGRGGEEKKEGEEHGEAEGDMFGRFVEGATKFSPLRIPQAILGRDWLSKYFRTETPQQTEEDKKREAVRKADEEYRKRLPKKALGDQFTIGGSGASDTEPVGFMGTPGERVTIEPRADMRESLQRQQDKADQALREHFARFHANDADRKRTSTLGELDPIKGTGAGGLGWRPPGTGPGGGLLTGPGGGTGGPGGPGGPGGDGRVSPGEATRTSPTGSIPSTIPGSVASLGYEPGKFTPVQDLTTASGVATSTGGGAGWLAQQRAGFAEELRKDPGLRTYFTQVIAKEARPGEEATAVAESVLNRAAASGVSLRQALSGKYARFFGPVNRGEIRPLSAEGAKLYGAAVDNAVGGSNLIQGSTDQGMYKEIHSAFRTKVDREWFGDWGGGRGFAANQAFREKLMQGYREAEARKGQEAPARSAVQTAKITTSDPGSLTGFLDPNQTKMPAVATAGADVSPYAMSGGAAERGAEKSWQNMTPEMRARMTAMWNDMPEHVRKGLSIHSGWRSLQTQAALASQPHTHPVAAPTPNAPHVRGEAADLTYGSPESQKWIHENAGKYGLHFNVGGEPWHIALNRENKRVWAAEAAAATPGAPVTTIKTKPGDAPDAGLFSPKSIADVSPKPDATVATERSAFARRAMEQRRARGEGLTGLRQRSERAAGKTPAAVRAFEGGKAAGKTPAAVQAHEGAKAAGKSVAAVKAFQARQAAAPAPEPASELAEGGTAGAGQDVLVGEEGPEILTMGPRSGQVVTPQQAMQGGGYGGASIIEPIIRPRVELFGARSPRWSRHAERARTLDITRDNARMAHTDQGFA